MERVAIIEALLFVHGEPLALGTIAKAARCSKEEALESLRMLEGEYAGRGLILLKKDECYQLGSNPRYGGYVEAMMKGEFNEELSKAALETLAIVAYKGPLTRIDIEYIRGVNSSFILRSLLLRGLIERVENPKDARSYLYRASFDLLKYFGIATREELPGYREFHEKTVEAPEKKPNSELFHESFPQ